MPVNIISYLPTSNQANYEDSQNLTALEKTYTAYFEHQGETVIFWRESSLRGLAGITVGHQHQTDQHFLYLFTSLHGIEAIKTLEKHKLIDHTQSHIQIIWSGNQPMQGLEDLTAHTVYLPKFSSKETTKLHRDCTLVRLPGIPALPLEPRSPPADTTIQTTAPDDKLHSNSKMIWVLGGDALKANAGAELTMENWQLLPKQHPVRVVNLLAENGILASLDHVTIINRDRTGLMQPKDGQSDSQQHLFQHATGLQETTYHYHPSSAGYTDPVTEAAITCIEEHCAYEVCHFWQPPQGGKTAMQSTREGKIDNFLLDPNTILLMPGDSSTEVSKLISSAACIEKRAQIYVAIGESTPDRQRAWILDLYSQGYFSCVDVHTDSSLDDILYPVCLTDEPPTPKNITGAIYQHLQQQPAQSCQTSTLKL